MMKRHGEGFILTEENATEVAEWCDGKLVEEIDPVDPEKKQPAINVQTIDGIQRMHIGDSIRFLIDYDGYQLARPYPKTSERPT
jgi:hypothetical protein